ncbi:zinc-ribbon and DUF3426 domain-containing protein [Caldimonas tepidiphila]|uniref:zinc-ribbon and DUF3426 domain-containing protein n=1 Tax=Caldimonas tepidiphila TaxID=2315841 RepID=UPI000E5A2990|nr:zinc-ribbon and DUF3426 domain-containing protein [Caldimonas tepidiphila]
MSFATSCPSCGTTFRVVRDQLKVSEGWVRCGRCGEVFCALDSLFEFDPQDTPSAPGGGADAGTGEAAPPPPAAAAAGSAQQARAAVAAPPEPPAPPSEPPPAPAATPHDEDADTVPFDEIGPVAPLAPRASQAATGLGVPPPAASPSASVLPKDPPLAAPRPPGAAAAPSSVETPRRDDASLLRPARLLAAPSDDDDAATSADVLDSRFFEDQDADAAWPAPGEPASAGPEFSDARFSSTLGESDFEPAGAASDDSPTAAQLAVATAAAAPAEAAAAAAEPVSEARPSLPASLESEEAAQPGFLKQARREERLKRPAVRAAMAALAGVLLLLLALQVLVQQREVLAAEVPAMRPWLEGWCRLSGCELGPLRRIDDVVLDHSALADAAPGGSGYRLSLLLRNRSDATLALPAFELTLTDTSGQVVARRVLRPADFGSDETRIAPRAQIALSIEIDTPGRRLAGYTVETFYP